MMHARKGASSRNTRGNMLVLVTAITVGIVLALIAFCYNYVRLFASQGQSKNAIDSAALTAAADLSRIVVNTNEYGYVSLSDVAPTGPATVATDQYFLPVHSINSLIGTCRLENQLAVQMQDPVFSALAQYDLTQAQSAIAQLETVLAASLVSGGTAKDIYGNTITPYADAEAAYKSNDLRTGQTYVAGSLVLSLGALTKPIPTNVTIPQPTTMSGLQSSQSQNNYYLSDTLVPFGNGTSQYGSQNVVLAAVAQTTRLVDPTTFTAKLAGIPTSQQMLAAVKAVASELVVDSQNPQGNTVVVTSCAIPANNVDPRPAPGALSISFPDGQIPDWKTPMAMLTDTQMNTNLTDLQQATGGDYPTDNGSTMSEMSSFWISQPASEANIARVCFYDWVRRAGTKANISSIINTLNTNFNAASPTAKDWWTYTAASPTTAVDVSLQAQGSPQIPQGIMHIYKFNADGTVAYTSNNLMPWPYDVLSQNQMFGESLGGYTSGTITQPVFVFSGGINLYNQQNLLSFFTGLFDPGGTENVASVTFTNFFDMYARDEVRQPGKLLGGKHGGEPLNNSQVAFHPKLHNTFCNIAMLPPSLRRACLDLGGGGSGAWHHNTGHGGGQNGNGGNGGGGGSGAGGQGPSGNTGGWGGGATPMIEPQSDFGENSYPASTYVKYSTGSGQVRPTYTTNGTAIDIRFRRQLTVSAQMQADLSNISDIGYLGYLGK